MHHYGHNVCSPLDASSTGMTSIPDAVRPTPAAHPHHPFTGRLLNQRTMCSYQMNLSKPIVNYDLFSEGGRHLHSHCKRDASSSPKISNPSLLSPAPFAVMECGHHSATHRVSITAMEAFLSSGVASGATNAGLPTADVEKVKVAVLAAGAFGMAMATLAARRGHDVVLYARDRETVEAINTTRRNPRVFPEHELLPLISATTSVADATQDAKIIIVCLPAQLTPDFLERFKDVIPRDALLVITCKGLYLKTKQLLSVPILEALGRDQPLCFLSGPSFALELMNNTPSAVVVASKYLYHAVYVQRALSTIDFRIYSSQDIIGVQLGGALKNPLAIGAGMIEGAGYGINTLAAYVTRSSLELQKLCVAMGGQPITISGLSGIGDLMLTAFGSLSRNRTCGIRIIKGEKVEDILKETTVEGVPTAEVAVYFAETCGIDLPIFRAVNAMLKGQIKREDLQDLLMNRPLKSET